MPNRVTVEAVKKLVSYNAKDGGLVWNVSRPKAPKGGFAGFVNKSAHTLRVRVMLEGTIVMVSHVVWVLHKGKWPTSNIDHIDRNPLNNRIENLREATVSENNFNRPIYRNNSSGYPGVSKERSGKWGATIFVKRKRIWLGAFSEKSEAIAARQKAEKIHFGDFAPKH